MKYAAAFVLAAALAGIETPHWSEIVLRWVATQLEAPGKPGPSPFPRPSPSPVPDGDEDEDDDTAASAPFGPEAQAIVNVTCNCSCRPQSCPVLTPYAGLGDVRQLSVAIALGACGQVGGVFLVSAATSIVRWINGGPAHEVRGGGRGPRRAGGIMA